MPNYTPMTLLKRYAGKTDTQSRAIYMLCASMGGIGPNIAFASRRTSSILRGLMIQTGWNMILVGNVPCTAPDNDVTVWADVIQIVADAELEENAPSMEKIYVCPDGIMIKFNPKTPTSIRETARCFDTYDAWGETPLKPVIVA